MKLPKHIYIVISRKAKTPVDYAADCRNDEDEAHRLASYRNKRKHCRCTDWHVMRVDTRVADRVKREDAA